MDAKSSDLWMGKQPRANRQVSVKLFYERALKCRAAGDGPQAKVFMRAAIGIDVGGTDIKVGIVLEDGRVLASKAIATWVGSGREGVILGTRAAIDYATATSRELGVKLTAVGMGLPGTVTGKRGLVLEDPPQIPGLVGFEAATFLRAETGLPAAVDNDASLAAFGESRVGAGRDVPTVLMITVGTGIGGGLVMAGQLVRGRYGTGGEIGHSGFDPQGPPCPHGGRGCLEMYCSATAVVREYVARGGNPASTARSVVEAARGGEDRALHVLTWAGNNLGRGLASFANVVPPDLILLGGGLSGAGELLLRPVRDGFAAQALPHVTKGVRIKAAILGNAAGMVGAALLAFEEGLG